MSPQNNVATASTKLDIITPQEDRDEHGLNIDRDSYALVMGDPTAGAFAVTGQPEDLQGFAERISDLLRRKLPRHGANSYSGPSHPIPATSPTSTGREHPRSIAETADQAAAILGPEWTANPGPWGVSATLTNGRAEVELGVENYRDFFINPSWTEPTYLPDVDPAQGLQLLPELIADRILTGRNAGQRLRLALAIAGIPTFIEPRTHNIGINLASAGQILITGDDTVTSDHDQTDHEGWLANHYPSLDSENMTTVYRTGNRDFTADTSAAVTAVTTYVQQLTC